MLFPDKSGADGARSVCTAIISALVHDRKLEAAVQKKIGTAVNTDDLEKELDTVKDRLRQLLSRIICFRKDL